MKNYFLITSLILLSGMAFALPVLGDDPNTSKFNIAVLFQVLPLVFVGLFFMIILIKFGSRFFGSHFTNFHSFFISDNILSRGSTRRQFLSIFFSYFLFFAMILLGTYLTAIGLYTFALLSFFSSGIVLFWIFGGLFTIGTTYARRSNSVGVLIFSFLPLILFALASSIVQALLGQNLSIYSLLSLVILLPIGLPFLLGVKSKLSSSYKINGLFLNILILIFVIAALFLFLGSFFARSIAY